MGKRPGNRKIFTSLKEFFELAYWKYARLIDSKLNNSHYNHFYTKYFSLTEEDYRGRTILDIGCGPRGSLEWADMCRERVGLDPLADKYMKMGARDHQMTYKKGYAEEIPFPDDYFDFVTTFNSIDHVESLQEFCSEIKRVLKPGGIFLLAVNIHEKPTLTKPQTLRWNFITRYFPSFSVHQEIYLENKVNNRIYTNMRLNRNVDSRKASNGVLVAKLVK